MGALVITSGDGRYAGMRSLGAPLELGPSMFAYEFHEDERDRAGRLARELTRTTGMQCEVVHRFTRHDFPPVYRDCVIHGTALVNGSCPMCDAENAALHPLHRCSR